MDPLFSGYGMEFLIGLGLSIVAGFLIGTEREMRGKSAGISTQSLVIGGAMIFTLLSVALEPDNAARIAANIVTGVGFLGAGIIMKSEEGEIKNLTTAASIWFSASIGMSIGFGWYGVALIATAYSVLVPRIPHIRTLKKNHDR